MRHLAVPSCCSREIEYGRVSNVLKTRFLTNWFTSRVAPTRLTVRPRARFSWSGLIFVWNGRRAVSLNTYEALCAFQKYGVAAGPSRPKLTRAHILGNAEWWTDCLVNRMTVVCQTAEPLSRLLYWAISGDWARRHFAMMEVKLAGLSVRRKAPGKGEQNRDRTVSIEVNG
jgi:hypothetical protein